MKSLKVTFLAFSLLAVLPTQASMRVIYGPDNRLDLNEHALTTFKQMGSAVAAQIETKKIVSDNNIYSVLGQTLVNYGICPAERFSHQVAAIRCSGFMVAKDIMVTSAQCVQNIDDCKTYSWIFDYKLNSTNDSAVKFKEEQLYSCKAILDRVYDVSSKIDYAIIRVDREITGRLPLKIRTAGVVPDGAKLFTIGTSLGLPLKISDNGNVINNQNEKYFTSNLDAYGGAAGAPIINEESLEVEGVYISGEKDFIFNPELNCSESKKCEGDASNCIGERATRITALPDLAKFKKKKFWEK